MLVEPEFEQAPVTLLSAGQDSGVAMLFQVEIHVTHEC